jgi:hypothetical protein
LWRFQLRRMFTNHTHYTHASGLGSNKHVKSCRGSGSAGKAAHSMEYCLFSHDLVPQTSHD